MDLTVLIGIIGGAIVLMIGISLTGTLFQYWDPASVFITVGGTTASVITSLTFKQMKDLVKIMRILLFPPKYDPVGTIYTLVSFAEKARRDGLLALEDDVEELDDIFLKEGLRLVVDGTDPEVVKAVMTTGLAYIEERHDQGRKIFEDAALFSPAYGMIGTLIGLINMLLHLDNPEILGPSMGTALITTMYGAILAYLVFYPIANKLYIRNKEEILLREIQIEGTLSIQRGDNPRILREKLAAFLPPSIRKRLEEEEISSRV